MARMLRFKSRMDGVQAPIIPVIGEMIRQTPGTISLGQGVVHYGPPKEAIEAAGEALSDPVTHEYQDGAGSPALLQRLAGKLGRENGIAVSGGRPVRVTAGGHQGVVHVVVAVTDPGDVAILTV